MNVCFDSPKKCINVSKHILKVFTLRTVYKHLQKINFRQDSLKHSIVGEPRVAIDPSCEGKGGRGIELSTFSVHSSADSPKAQKGLGLS